LRSNILGRCSTLFLHYRRKIIKEVVLSGCQFDKIDFILSLDISFLFSGKRYFQLYSLKVLATRHKDEHVHNTASAYNRPLINFYRLKTGSIMQHERRTAVYKSPFKQKKYFFPPTFLDETGQVSCSYI